jgi:hypothetical protein
LSSEYPGKRHPGKKTPVRMHQHQILVLRIEMRRVDYKLRQRATKAIVNALGKIETVRSAEKIKIS